jgi:hypothetical protein
MHLAKTSAAQVLEHFMAATAILADTRKAIAGTKVSIAAADSATEERIQKNSDDLKGSLLGGEFRPGSLRGTREVQRFSMMVSSGIRDEGVRLEFLDFPGQYLNPRLRDEAEWAKVQDFLTESTALLIPVDATVLMEAFEARHHQEIPRILQLGAVEEAMRYWAKYRQDVPLEPALVVFAPVKCESYFADNGGNRDFSAELFARFHDVYREVIDTARAELPHVRMTYVPVDSLGCVEVESVDWVVDTEKTAPPDALTPDVQYLVRPDKTRRVVGAIDILTPLIRQVVEASRVLQQEDTARASKAAAAAVADRDRKRGFWQRLRDNINGSKHRRAVLAADSTARASRELTRLKEYDTVLGKLAEQPAGARVKSI